MGYFYDFAPFSFRDADGRVRGVLIDCARLLCGGLGYRMTQGGFPWARAQAMVRDGQLDGFCTVPTEIRRAYVYFCDTPVLIEGHSLFHRKGDRRFEGMVSKADLAPFGLADYLGNGWAEKNLDGLNVDWLSNWESIPQKILAGRADAFVGEDTVARYKLRRLGLADDFGVTPAPYFSASNFTFGLRKTYPDAASLIAEFDIKTKALASAGRFRDIVRHYT